MSTDLTCAFCGASPAAIAATLPHDQQLYLMEHRGLTPPTHQYEIPACGDCESKAEHIHDVFYEDKPLDEALLDELVLDALVDQSAWE